MQSCGYYVAGIWLWCNNTACDLGRNLRSYCDNMIQRAKHVKLHAQRGAATAAYCLNFVWQVCARAVQHVLAGYVRCCCCHLWQTSTFCLLCWLRNRVGGAIVLAFWWLSPFIGPTHHMCFGVLVPCARIMQTMDSSVSVHIAHS